MMMKFLRFVFVTCLTVSSYVNALSLNNNHNQKNINNIINNNSNNGMFHAFDRYEDVMTTTTRTKNKNVINKSTMMTFQSNDKKKNDANIFVSTLLVVSFITTMTTNSLVAAAADGGGEYEYAELPPVYVPALIGVGLIVGVGALTASLGNIVDDGTCIMLLTNETKKKGVETCLNFLLLSFKKDNVL